MKDTIFKTRLNALIQGMKSNDQEIQFLGLVAMAQAINTSDAETVSLTDLDGKAVEVKPSGNISKMRDLILAIESQDKSKAKRLRVWVTTFSPIRIGKELTAKHGILSPEASAYRSFNLEGAVNVPFWEFEQQASQTPKFFTKYDIASQAQRLCDTFRDAISEERLVGLSKEQAQRELERLTNFVSGFGSPIQLEELKIDARAAKEKAKMRWLQENKQESIRVNPDAAAA